MFTVGQEVRVNHEGDKDDRRVGTVEAIKDGRYRVWFGDSGWLVR